MRQILIGCGLIVAFLLCNFHPMVGIVVGYAIGCWYGTQLQKERR